ncbi:MAG TPA: hypothetical protein VK932_27360 [Kofleriaceae bacterium]|nr:hypothetical protein [Kofleriaceae bacterium]
MISRIVLAMALVLLVAAPAPALAEALHIELAEEPSPADDEVVAPFTVPRAVAPLPAVRGARSEELAAPGPGTAGVFRPPRPRRA